MEAILTAAQQQQYFEEALHFKQTGRFEEAEARLLLIAANTLATHDYTQYVTAKTHLLIIYINTNQFSKMNATSQDIQPYRQFAEPSIVRDLHLIEIVHRMSFEVVTPDEEIAIYLPLIKEAAADQHMDHLYTLLGNAYATYTFNERANEALQLMAQYDPLLQREQATDVIGVFAYLMYQSEIYHVTQQIERIPPLLQQMEMDDLYHHVGDFAFFYWYYKAIVVEHAGDFETARAFFAQALTHKGAYYRARLEINRWLNVLKKYQCFEDIVRVQKLFIEIVDRHVRIAGSHERTRIIEEEAVTKLRGKLYEDRLTGAKNRAFYEDELVKGIAYTHFTLAVFDIDKFKHVNDTYGHLVGDKAIQFIAELAKECLHKPNIHVIRYGGDEFILLLHYPREVAMRHIEQLHTLIATTPLVVDGIQLKLTVSIGVSSTQEQPCHIETLFQAADKAVYEAKANGRNQIAYQKL